MNILYITGLFPKKENKMGGIFIAHRLSELKKRGIGFYCVIPIIEETKTTKIIKKILGRKYALNYPDNLELGNINFNFIKFHFPPSKRIFTSFEKKAAKEIIKTINTKYDIIHAHVIYPHGYIARIISKEIHIPYIVTAHGSDIYVYPNKDKTVKKHTVETLENARNAIFVSNKLLQKAKEFGYSGKNAIVIPNGVDHNIFFKINKKIAKKKLNLPKNKKIIGFIGNLVRIKGADRLPAIFKLIYQKNKNTEFVIIGDGKLKKSLKQELKNYPVIFTGIIEQKKVADYMNAMDIVLLPSRSEGWGCVILEAMSCGTYVIASNVGGISEAMGDYGTLIDTKNENIEKEFANATLKVLKKGYKPERLVNYASNFSWEKTIKKEIEIYKNVLTL